jgi:hypothetical protein
VSKATGPKCFRNSIIIWSGPSFQGSYGLSQFMRL